jgi:hypothetical protein
MVGQLLTDAIAELEGLTEQRRLIANILAEVGFTHAQQITISGYFMKGYVSRCKLNPRIYHNAEAQQALEDAIAWAVEADDLPPAYRNGEVHIRFRSLH